MVDNSTATIFACTPIHQGGVHHMYMAGALSCVTKFAGRIRWDVKVGSFLPRNRDTLTSRFWESGCDYMLCVDSDVGFDAEDVQRLLDADVDFVSGCYALKTPDASIPARLLLAERGPLRACDYVPGGFLLLKRSVIERMIEHYADLEYNGGGQKCWALWSSLFVPGKSYDGEDVSFCRRWRAMGGKIWLHTGVTLQHYGDKAYVPKPLGRRTVPTQSEVAESIRQHSKLHDPGAEIEAIFTAFIGCTGERFLEIGTFRGATAAAVRYQFPTADIVTIDLPDAALSSWNAQDNNLVGACFHELGMADAISQIRADSKQALPAMAERGERFDCILIDGDHSVLGCTADLKNAAKILAQDGCILVHDYTDESDADRPRWTKDVAKAVDAFAGHTWRKTRLAGWLVKLERADADATGDTSAA